METHRYIIERLANGLCESITRKAIRNLQQIDAGFIGECGLKSAWDEICVQMQKGQFDSPDVYHQVISDAMIGYLEDLNYYKCSAIWLQTEDGRRQNDEGEELAFTRWELVDFIASQYIYPAADRWRNKRIKAYHELAY